MLMAIWTIWSVSRMVPHLQWTESANSVASRTGWLSRFTTVVRFDRIQSVTRSASPWDRRAGMAHVTVDTAGNATGAEMRVRYLPTAIAIGLSERLAARAAETSFSW
jgi:membrane protein YdbS with pleckstrin-like domain